MTTLLSGYLTQDEAAARLGIGRRTLTRWGSQRKGPPFTRVGRQTLYRESGILEWMLSREQKPAETRRKSNSV